MDPSRPFVLPECEAAGKYAALHAHGDPVTHEYLRKAFERGRLAWFGQRKEPPVTFSPMEVDAWIAGRMYQDADIVQFIEREFGDPTIKRN